MYSKTPPHELGDQIEATMLLSPAKCESIVDTVLSLFPYFTDRGCFYTLGATTYQDDPLAYPHIANELNKLLRWNFASLYNRVYQYFNMNYTEWDGLGLPGFHIFEAKANGVQGTPHIDEPYLHIVEGIDSSEHFSFTLPLEMPPRGGGLDYWPNATDKEIQLAQSKGALPEHKYLPYRVGHIYVHTGKFPHRIANPCTMYPGQFRITLQGHGLTTVDGYRLLYF